MTKNILTGQQITSLSSLYIMLFRSLNPAIYVNDGEAYAADPTMSDAAQGAAEVALIDVCNQISCIVNDSDRWSIDKRDEADYIQDTAKVIEREVLERLGIKAQAMQAQQLAVEKGKKPDEQK